MNEEKLLRLRIIEKIRAIKIAKNLNLEKRRANYGIAFGFDNELGLSVNAIYDLVFGFKLNKSFLDFFYLKWKYKIMLYDKDPIAHHVHSSYDNELFLYRSSIFSHTLHHTKKGYFESIIGFEKFYKKNVKTSKLKKFLLKEIINYLLERYKKIKFFNKKLYIE